MEVSISSEEKKLQERGTEHITSIQLRKRKRGHKEGELSKAYRRREKQFPVHKQSFMW